MYAVRLKLRKNATLSHTIPHIITSSQTAPYHHIIPYHIITYHIISCHIISHQTTLCYTTLMIKWNNKIQAISIDSWCLMIYHPIAPPINSCTLIDVVCQCRKCDIENSPDEMIECIQSGPNTHWARNKPPRAENRC